MKILSIFLLMSTILLGAPAFDRLKEFKQADGTTFLAKGQGNHHLNWIETQDGDILKYNEESKNFDYATIEKNNLKASGEKFEKQSLRRAKSLNQVQKTDKKSIHELWSKKREEAQKRRSFKD